MYKIASPIISTEKKSSHEKRNEYCRQWRKDNKDRISEYNRIYATQHRSEIKERMSKWRKENHEHIVAYNEKNSYRDRQRERKYYLENAEKVKESKNRWYRDNFEQAKKASHKWCKENHEKKKAMSKKWFDEHPEKRRDYEHKRRALKYETASEKVNDLEIFDRDGWTCQLCHKKVNRKLKHPHPLSASLDHIIPLSNGGQHSYKNVQLAHLSCNVRAGVGGIKQIRLF